jgi:hypothetical protein
MNEWRVAGTTTEGEKVIVIKKARLGHAAISFVAKDLGIKWQAVCAVKVKPEN